MRPDDLKIFLQILARADQLVRVPVAVDAHLELATIVNHYLKERMGHKALLFEQVKGSAMSVAVNLFGTEERVGWALGTTDPAGLAERLSVDLAAIGKADADAALAEICAVSKWQPILSSASEWLANSTGAQGLERLPRIQAWPGDGGPFLTLGQVYSRDPVNGAINCGMYRLQLHDGEVVTIRCRRSSGMARHCLAWRRQGASMPVAIALGGPPVMTWAAGVTLPETVDEAAFCGYLTGSPITMGSCQHSDLLVPASAEVVIEGFVDPGATRAEGPFGNHTGTYDAEDAAPVLRVVAVHLRSNTICPWTLVGPPPMENVALAKMTVQLLMPLVRMAIPTVRMLHMPDVGIYHRATLVSVTHDEDRPLPVLAQLLRRTLLLKGAKLLVICADDHDPHDAQGVFWRVLNRVDWSRDVLVDDGLLTIDARRLPAGGLVQCRPDILARVLSRWGEYRIT